MLTAEKIKQKAMELGADICKIGDISLFSAENPSRDPRMILPKGKCVIGAAFRVPRGLYKAMESREQYLNYVTMGVKYADEELAEIFLLKMASFIEDEGYDACVQRNVSNLKIKGDKTQNPELMDTYELIHAVPVEDGKPAPEVILDFCEAAKICGMGAASIKGNLLTKKFGPFQRLVFIITDAPLECDAPFEENLCDGCMKCAEVCPGNAIDEKGLDSWQCSVYYRGAHKSNPFMYDDFLKNNPEKTAILEGEKRFNAESAREIYPSLDFLPAFSGYAPCLCGKKCDTVCYNHLKEVGAIE